MLPAQDLRMKGLKDDECLFSKCGILVPEGLCFESVATSNEYLTVHDNGNILIVEEI